MGKKKGKEIKKKQIVAIIGAVAIVAVVVIVIVAIMNKNEVIPIGDDYFVSDDSKIVLNIDGSTVEAVTNDQRPSVVHTVYYYGGDKINDMKVFFEYANDELASNMSEQIGDSYKGWAKGKQVNGKYIVFQMDRSEYENLTAEAIRDNIKNIEAVMDTL